MISCGLLLKSMYFQYSVSKKPSQLSRCKLYINFRIYIVVMVNALCAFIGFFLKGHLE